MLRRGLVAALLAAGLLAATAAPVQAIPPGESLIVLAYFSDPEKTQIIGQQWYGCGQPPGSWGVLGGYRTLYFTPC
ncbi:hypothetical protein OG792_12000 [Micromonospora sp. NBC_01699]|uniref:hypothetical protein n=1 Tax=Micromonospora sp. NBC_01699 TaxID=2975984 RepID=UPI002E3644D9|nr:hypothetical protein [Micromonospora sp. NBC_01699]